MNHAISPEKRQRFVWAVRWVPAPPNMGGDAVYTWGLIRSLGEQADVDIVAFDNGTAQPVAAPGLTWHILPLPKRPRWRSVPSLLPNVAFQHHGDAYRDKVLALAAGADGVLLDHLGVYWLAPALHAAARRGAVTAPVVPMSQNRETLIRGDMHTFVTNPVMRAAIWWDGQKSTKLEHTALSLADGVTVICQEDLDGFRAELPTKPMLVLSPGYDGAVTESRVIDDTTPMRVCLLGGRGAFHKQLVLFEALKGLSALPVEAGIEVEVVGGIDSDLKDRLVRANPRLVFRGFVDDLASYLRTVRLALLADVVGGGFKVRALTLGHQRVPMVAVRGALSGSGLVAGTDFAEYPDIPALVADLPKLVRDIDRLNTLQNNAFQRMNGQYNPPSRAVALRGFFAELQANPARALGASRP